MGLVTTRPGLSAGFGVPTNATKCFEHFPEFYRENARTPSEESDRIENLHRGKCLECLVALVAEGDLVGGS